MSVLWRRFLAALTPGVLVVLSLWWLVWLTELLGQRLHAFDLAGWLGLSGVDFWRGQVWRLVTYALEPRDVMDLVMNSVALVLVGGLLERHWTRGQLWVYGLVTTMGAGLVKVMLQSSNPMPLTGAAPMVSGLLIAWGFLCGRETVTLPFLGATTVWRLVLVVSGASFLMAFFAIGLVPALIMVAGGVIGFAFLWVKHNWLMNRAGSVVHSERIQRLEL